MGKTIKIDTSATATALTELGQRIHHLRKKHGLTGVELAKAANISRVTLHRIERGEPSVTAGAYATVLHALGERLGVNNPDAETDIPEKIALSKYPQLKTLSWQLKPSAELTQQEAWGIYSRNWRHLDASALNTSEEALIRHLKNKFEVERDV